MSMTEKEKKNNGPIIELRNLTSGYDNKVILHDMNLVVKPSEILTVIGGSGSGKSTLLKTIMRFARIFSGEMYIDNIRADKLSESRLNQVRMKMGMVFQGAALFDSMTVYENVAFPLIEKRSLPKKDIKERVMEILAQLDMENAKDSLPDEISGGMKKRVGLARALVERPMIILYDEPTSGLDPVMTKHVNEMIKQARDNFGVTSVVVSHDMPSTFTISDRISAIFNGTIIRTGTPGDIRSSMEPELYEFIHSVGE
jgi:phospholipid/cholesterol/gamma-HCH transport system ATP-binding protein